MKIANDVRWLAEWSRSGLGESIIPANEPEALLCQENKSNAK